MRSFVASDRGARITGSEALHPSLNANILGVPLANDLGDAGCLEPFATWLGSVGRRTKGVLNKGTSALNRGGNKSGEAPLGYRGGS